jgi:hypothetical protein
MAAITTALCTAQPIRSTRSHAAGAEEGRGCVLALGSINPTPKTRTPSYGLGEGSLVATGLFDVADQRMTD